MKHAAKPDIPLRADGGPPRRTVRIADATMMLCIGRSKLFELISGGEIEAIKLGTAALIIVASIHALIEHQRDRGSE